MERKKSSEPNHPPPHFLILWAGILQPKNSKNSFSKRNGSWWLYHTFGLVGHISQIHSPWCHLEAIFHVSRRLEGNIQVPSIEVDLSREGVGFPQVEKNDEKKQHAKSEVIQILQTGRAKFLNLDVYIACIFTCVCVYIYIYICTLWFKPWPFGGVEMTF